MPTISPGSPLIPSKSLLRLLCKFNTVLTSHKFSTIYAWRHDALCSMKLSCIVPHTSMLLYGFKMLSNLIKSFKFATAQEERRTDIVRCGQWLKQVKRSSQDLLGCSVMNHESELDLVTPNSVHFPLCHVASMGCNFTLSAEHSSLRRWSSTGPQQDKLLYFDISYSHAHMPPPTIWPLLISDNTIRWGQSITICLWNIYYVSRHW